MSYVPIDDYVPLEGLSSKEQATRFYKFAQEQEYARKLREAAEERQFTITQNAADDTYRLLRISFESEQKEANVSDPDIISAIMADIVKLLHDSLPRKIQTIDKLSVGVEAHSSKHTKTTRKGELCKLHAHIHIRGKSLDPTDSQFTKYKETFAKGVSTIFVKNKGILKTNYGNKKTSWRNMDLKKCGEQPERILYYPQKFYNKYKGTPHEWCNYINDKYSMSCDGFLDVYGWREKAGNEWTLSMQHQEKLDEMSKNSDLIGWWQEIYEKMDKISNPTIYELIETAVLHYKLKCSRGFSEKEIIERIKTYRLSREQVDHHQIVSQLHKMY